jgi:hypothetical protein
MATPASSWFTPPRSRRGRSPRRRWAVVGRAGHREGDVDILNELRRVVGASCRRLDTHLCRTAQRDVGRCYASSCHKGSRSEENLFHGFSLVFTLKVHLKTDIRIEYASLSLVGSGLQGTPGTVQFILRDAWCRHVTHRGAPGSKGKWPTLGSRNIGESRAGHGTCRCARSARFAPGAIRRRHLSVIRACGPRTAVLPPSVGFCS